jgi:Na+-transporting methylmalonyl-CoA/oxaloacetate decarboxylase gamma subunit
MIDWGMVFKITGGGYGINILVLAILAVIAWIIGMVVNKFKVKGK